MRLEPVVKRKSVRVPRRTASFARVTFRDGYSTSPIGAIPRLRNASRREVCILRTRVARWIAQVSSFVVACITTATSPRSLVAAAAAQTAFITLSLEGRSADRWDPTKTMGTGVSIMKLRAAAL